MRMTYAPPEQSEPAITSNRPWTMLVGGEVLEGAPGASKKHFYVLGLDIMRGSTRYDLITVGAGRKDSTSWPRQKPRNLVDSSSRNRPITIFRAVCSAQ